MQYKIKIHKIELIVFGVLILFYLNNMFGIEDVPGFAVLNFVAFFILTSTGVHIYLLPQYTNRTKALLFAFLCGISFATGILGIALKTWNWSNWLLITFGSLNLILFFVLLFQIRRTKKGSGEHYAYYKGLLIRSSIILLLSVILLVLPYQIINLYINKNRPVLHSRGLADRYYDQALTYMDESKYKEAYETIQFALREYQKGYEGNIDMYPQAYELLYHTTLKMLLKYASESNIEKTLEFAELIQKPTRIYYGDSCKQMADIKTIQAEVYIRTEKFDLADSLIKDALRRYKALFKSENLFYTSTLKLLAKSYYEQHYYSNALSLYRHAIYLLKKDTANYVPLGHDKDIVINSIADANACIAKIYSVKQRYDSADLYFKRAFDCGSFVNDRSYLDGLTQFAFHILNKGDYRYAKTIIKNVIELTEKRYGQLNYSYTDALIALVRIDVAMANYKEAEEGCNKTMEIILRIANEKDGYFLYSKTQLAIVKHCQGYYREAEDMLKEILAVTSKESIYYADVLVVLSRLKCDLTEYSSAFEMSGQAVKIASEYYGDMNIQKITEYFRNDAYVNYLLNNIDESEKIYLKCFSLDTSDNSGGSKLGYASTLNGLGLIKTARKKYKIADTLFNAAIVINEKQFGKIHPECAILFYNLGYLRLGEGRLEEAEALFKEAADIIRQVLNEKHDKMADNLVGIGEVKLKQKKNSEALKYFRNALEIYKIKFKPEHKRIIMTSAYIKRLEE